MASGTSFLHDAAPGEALIRVRNAWKTYHIGEIQVPAVRGVDLEVPKGQFVAVMGPSGSGKSTFMHLLGCLDRMDKGEYWLAGNLVNSLNKKELAALRNRLIGFVFQSYNLLSRTSVLDNVALPLTYQDVDRRERRRRAGEVLDRVGLSDRTHHYSNQLSGGQQQRVAIARSLITNPVLVLADEPTGNLDSKTSREIMALLQDLNRESYVTIALVTHEVDIAEYAQRVVSFRDGVVNTDVMNTWVRDAHSTDAQHAEAVAN
ncbi:MAG: ABC transporter ATP-binding protein [Planctomycetota bacterium]